MSNREGWKALRQREWERARSHFQRQLQSGSDTAEAKRGLARVAIARGALDRAHDLAEQAFQEFPGADAAVTLGFVFSEMGRRDEATRYLQNALREDPDHGLGQVLLGEQKIRRGQWEQGTKSIIQGLRADDDGDAYAHLRQICIDLSEAVAAGKIGAPVALKFVNRLDYTAPRDHRGITPFLASVRRALSEERPLEAGRESSSRGSSTSPAASSGPPPRSAPTSPPRSTSTQLVGGSTTSRSRSSAGAPPRSAPTSLAPKGGRPSSTGSVTTAHRELSEAGQELRRRVGEVQRAIELEDGSEEARLAISRASSPAESFTLLDQIREDRRMNEHLQDRLDIDAVPSWPSEYDVQLDTIESMRREETLTDIYGAMTDAPDFQLTDGGLESEIFLERCRQSLLSAASSFESHAIPLAPESISRIELNCYDGLLERLPPLDEISVEAFGVEQYELRALGSFLGACVANSYGGVWHYDENQPERSTILVGYARLEPFDIARRWLEADDKDTVSLESLHYEALQALPPASFYVATYQFVDPTRGLSRDGMPPKLAELWSRYRFELSKIPHSTLATAIDILHVTEPVVFFSIEQRYAPELPQTNRGWGLLSEDSVALAFVRATGEFLHLSSRKAIARCVEELFETISSERVGDILDLIAMSFLARESIVRTRDQAEALSRRTGASLDAPGVEHLHGGDTRLRFYSVARGAATEWSLEHRPQSTRPWRLIAD
jgi:hypothetical protein